MNLLNFVNTFSGHKSPRSQSTCEYLMKPRWWSFTSWALKYVGLNHASCVLVTNSIAGNEVISSTKYEKAYNIECLIRNNVECADLQFCHC